MGFLQNYLKDYFQSINLSFSRVFKIKPYSKRGLHLADAFEDVNTLLNLLLLYFDFIWIFANLFDIALI